MQQESYLKCPCEKCGAPIEFPAEGLGQSISCPHCGENTNLFEVQGEVANPPVPNARKRKPILLIALGCAALSAALAFGIFAAKKSSKAEQPAKALPETKSKDEDVAPKKDRPKKSPAKRVKAATHQIFEQNDLKVTDVMLEKSDTSRLVYATGVIHNNSERQRFGVKIELDLFDAQDAKIGTASDYIQFIEKSSELKFKALVTDGKTVRAKVISISEE